jgi:four helix bundle protein
MKGGQPEDLRTRTKRFSLDVVALFASLPRTDASMVLGKQLLRSSTSAGAQYREACRARSTAEFISKVEGALQELDESSYWLELLLESGIATGPSTRRLYGECDELIRIFVSVVRKAKGE